MFLPFPSCATVFFLFASFSTVKSGMAKGRFFLLKRNYCLWIFWFLSCISTAMRRSLIPFVHLFRYCIETA